MLQPVKLTFDVISCKLQGISEDRNRAPLVKQFIAWRFTLQNDHSGSKEYLIIS
jgi:hypothetical protein